MMGDVVTLKLTGADNVLALLLALPPQIVSKRGGPAKLALKRGAQVLRDQVAQNLQASIAQSTDERDRHDTGLALRSLTVTRGKPPPTPGERYLVRFKKASYVRAGEPVTTLKVMQLKEYGSSHQRAFPVIRPAFTLKAPAAIDAVVTYLVAAVDKLAQQYLAGGRA